MKGPAGDAEAAGGLAFVAAGGGKRPEDRLPLHRFEGGGSGACPAVVGLSRRRRHPGMRCRKRPVCGGAVAASSASCREAAVPGRFGKTDGAAAGCGSGGRRARLRLVEVLPPGEDDPPFHRVHQFPDVSRPGVAEQTIHRLRGEPLDRLAVLFGEADEKILGQKRNVLDPLPERRDVERDDIQPVEEVFAETPGCDLRQEIPVRRGDQADIDLDHLLAADAGDLPLLEDAQELHLHPERHLAHLVEKKAPPVGLAELPLPAPVGPGEGPLLVAEEFRFQQGLGDRRAVELDEWPLLPRGC